MTRVLYVLAVLGLRWRRSEEHTSELQSLTNLVCRLLLEKKKTTARPTVLHPVSTACRARSKRKGACAKSPASDHVRSVPHSPLAPAPGASSPCAHRVHR